MKLLILLSLFSTLAFSETITCDWLDEYNFNVVGIKAEIDQFETEAVVFLQKQPGDDYVQFPYNKKVVMKFKIGGPDGKWFQNDYDYPGEDYQFFLGTERDKVRFWVDIWTDDFMGFATIYSESCYSRP